MAGRPVVTIKKDKNGDWRWHLRVSSDLTLDSGEGYASESNARRAVRRAKLALPIAKVVSE